MTGLPSAGGNSASTKFALEEVMLEDAGLSEIWVHALVLVLPRSTFLNLTFQPFQSCLSRTLIFKPAET